VGPVVLPGDCGNLKRRLAGHYVLGMEDEVVAFRLHQHGCAAGPEPAAVREEQLRAAALEHGCRRFIKIRAGHFAGAAYHGAVVAPGAPATEVEGDEEVVVAAVVNEKWSFDRLPVSGGAVTIPGANIMRPKLRTCAFYSRLRIACGRKKI